MEEKLTKNTSCESKREQDLKYDCKPCTDTSNSFSSPIQAVICCRAEPFTPSCSISDRHCHCISSLSILLFRPRRLLTPHISTTLRTQCAVPRRKPKAGGIRGGGEGGGYTQGCTEGERPCTSPSRSIALLPASPQERGLSWGLTLLRSTLSFQRGHTSQEEALWPLWTAAINPRAYKTPLLRAWELSRQPENLGFPRTRVLFCTFRAKIPPHQHDLSGPYCSARSKHPHLHGQLRTLAHTPSVPPAPAQPPGPRPAGSRCPPNALACTNQPGRFPSRGRFPPPGPALPHPALSSGTLLFFREMQAKPAPPQPTDSSHHSRLAFGGSLLRGRNARLLSPPDFAGWRWLQRGRLWQPRQFNGQGLCFPPKRPLLMGRLWVGCLKHLQWFPFPLRLTERLQAFPHRLQPLTTKLAWHLELWNSPSMASRDSPASTFKLIYPFRAPNWIPNPDFIRMQNRPMS